MRFVLHCVATFALFGVVVTRGAAGAGSPERPASAVPCRPPPLSSSYVRRVRAALVAKRDIWGNALLRMNSGPTYERAQRYLEPLFHAEGPQMRRLTDSDVYYLAFAQPHGPAGGGTVALHVADGSEIISDRVDGSKLALDVGPDGRERYGSCTARLSSPRLFRGYQPILETGYVDENGVRFTQESFATRVSETDSLVSFVRLTIDAPGGSRPERIRFTLRIRVSRPATDNSSAVTTRISSSAKAATPQARPSSTRPEGPTARSRRGFTWHGSTVPLRADRSLSTNMRTSRPAER